MKFKKIYFIIFAIIVVAIMLVIKNINYIPTVVKTIPTNDANGILETSQIEIFFKNDLDENHKKDISINIEPSVNFDYTWNLNVLKVIPKSKMDNSKKYEIRISYKNRNIYNLKFSTETFSQEQIQKYGNLQTKDDLLYGKAIIDITQKYPWYSSLPIRSLNYVVYYDFDREEFLIGFTKIITDKKQIDYFTNEALDKIKKIGGKDPIKFRISQPTN